MARKTKEEIIYGSDKVIEKNLKQNVRIELTARNAKEYDALLFDYIEKELRGAND